MSDKLTSLRPIDFDQRGLTNLGNGGSTGSTQIKQATHGAEINGTTYTRDTKKVRSGRVIWVEYYDPLP